MKYKTKDIKKLGRTYGKRKFKLINSMEELTIGIHFLGGIDICG